MSLTLSLNNALSGLKANQQAIGVLSHNIANANTDGYSRQVVMQQASYIDGVGAGVRIDEVVRKVDKYLSRAVQTQGSEVSRTSVMSEYYSRMNVLMGQPGAQNTLDETITGFFNSLQTLSETPDRTSARSDVLAASQRMAGTMSDLAYNLNDLRFEADREISEAVDGVNSLITRLNDLNKNINAAGSLGQSLAGLHDQRDAALRELSGYLDISTNYYNDYGAVNVITGSGSALVDGIPRKLFYNASQSTDIFTNDSALNALQIFDVDDNGNPIRTPTNLITAGTEGNVTSVLSGGKIEGLRLMRDEVLPAMLNQLDMLSANMRDAVNAVHNDGSGFPPASSLTATRSVAANKNYNWQGSVRIAVLQKDGNPVPAGYLDEAYTGIRPLTLQLGSLNGGDGAGYLTVNDIVKEINQHFGAPLSKAKLGDLNSIKLVSNSDALVVGVPSTFDFELELENLSANGAQVFVGGVTVRDSLGADITNVTQAPPTIPLDTTNTYYTTAGIPDVTINFPTPPGVQVGDYIYLGPPSTANVNGILATNITGYFRVEAIGGNSVTIFANQAAATTGNVSDPSGVEVTTTNNSASVPSGATVRTGDGIPMQLDLGMNPNSAYYDITVSVATVNADGELLASNITYRVLNGQNGIHNTRYGAAVASGDGQVVIPGTSQDSIRAILVDDKGNELPRINGEYVNSSPSYLKIMGTNSEYTVVIDEMDSRQMGDLDGNPQEQGTNRGFSHYFGLNDFFVANEATPTGELQRNSALNLKVSQRLIDNPNLISTGDLVLQRQPTVAGQTPQFTYVRYSGDNQLATRLVNVSTQNLAFAATGGLPAIDLTLMGYTSELLGYFASNSASSADMAENAQILYDGFKARSDAISGVNLDEELANTVVFQNSYAATARIVTVVDEMFQDILQMI